MCALNDLLMRLGTNARTRRRREIFNRVIPRLVEGTVVPLEERVGDIDAARKRIGEELEKLRRDLRTEKSTCS